jgi:hypothetical protein
MFSERIVLLWVLDSLPQALDVIPLVYNGLLSVAL